MDETNNSAGDGRAARRAEWRRILSEQQASGRNVAAFCRERGIPVWKFCYWRKTLTAEETGGFVQMRVSTAQETVSHMWVEAGRWRICVLYWDRDGLALWAKRLARGRFAPRPEGPVEIGRDELILLLEGVRARVVSRSPRWHTC